MIAERSRVQRRAKKNLLVSEFGRGDIWRGVSSISGASEEDERVPFLPSEVEQRTKTSS